MKNCPACKNVNETDIDSCVRCEFPFNGSDKEKSIHIGKFIGQKGIITDSEDSLTKSQNFLYLAAAFYLVGVIVNFQYLKQDIFALSFSVIVILVILICGFLVKKSPLLFLSIPLALLLFIYTINYLIDPRTLFQGIIFKLLILGSLIYSIYNYKLSEKFKKKYNI
ncbi:zinc finger Ran-binding domain-containing protein [Flavobacteriaceae bacterium GSB9]|nr:zinc finger Ran-binding domain-containing protein [Flavobacteriaceae bacterium GSB9]